MDRRFERSLSFILSLFVLAVFLLTIVSKSINIYLISNIWYISFLISWGFMLIYSLHVLLQKDSFGFSILVAIITAIGFGVLSIPAILMLGRFIPIMPQVLTYNNVFLDNNNQAVIYTTLIVLYFAHLFNAIKLTSYQNKINKELEEDMDYEDEDIEVNLDDEFVEDNLNEENIDKKDDVDKVIKDDIKVIKVDSNNDYKVEKVVEVEDLEEEIDFKEGED